MGAKWREWGWLSAASVLAYALASGALVIVSNLLVLELQFALPVVLTLLQMVALAVATRIARALRLLPQGHGQLALHGRHGVAWLGTALAASALLTNQSLVHNSVPFFMAARVLVTPAVAFLLAALHGTQFSGRLKAVLTALVAGIALAAVTDVQLNVAGTLWALASAAATALYQIRLHATLARARASSMQLLLQQTPIACVLLLAAVAAGEDWILLRTMEWSLLQMVALVGVCLLYVAQHFALFLALHRTASRAFNVVVLTRTLATVVASFVVFRYPTRVANLTALLGAWGIYALYADMRLREPAFSQLSLARGASSAESWAGLSSSLPTAYDATNLGKLSRRVS